MMPLPAWVVWAVFLYCSLSVMFFLVLLPCWWLRARQWAVV
jgi:hypothetical protein